MMWAATLAGIAFGNSGVHLPHAMAYSVAGLIRDYRPAGFPGSEPICPHGISVIVNAPSVLRTTAAALPARHIERRRVARRRYARRGAGRRGEVLVSRIVRMMRTRGCRTAWRAGLRRRRRPEPGRRRLAQQRLLTNAPIAVDSGIAAGALSEGRKPIGEFEESAPWRVGGFIICQNHQITKSPNHRVQQSTNCTDFIHAPNYSDR